MNTHYNIRKLADHFSLNCFAIEANFVKFSIGFGDSISYINKLWRYNEEGQLNLVLIQL